MSLTQNTSPGDQVLTKNPVVWEFSTDNEFSINGQQSIQTLSLDKIPDDGDTVSLEWLNGGRVLTFTFRDTPDDSGLELDRSGAHANVASYIQNLLLAELNSNYFINLDFEVSYLATDKILFKSRTESSDYDFTSTSHSGSITVTHTISQAGVTPVRRPNFRIVSEISMRYVGDPDWDRSELELVPIEGEVIFDFKNLLQSYDKMVLPPLNSAQIVDASSQIVEFMTRFAEAFGTALSVQRSAVSNVKYGIYGGFNLRDRLGFNFESAILPEFLTHRNVIHLREVQPYFLALWNQDSEIQNANVQCVLTYSDGTSSTNNLYTETFAPFSLSLIPVGHSRLSSIAVSGKTISRAIVGVDGLVSGVTIVFDRKNVRKETIIAYRNSFGVIETEVFTGEVLKTFKTEAETTDLWKKWNDPVQEPRTVKFQGENVFGLKVNSGWFSKERAELLADFLSSELHFLIINGKYIPVILKVNEFEISGTRSGSFNSFDIEVLFTKDQNFSDVGDRIE